MIYLRQSTASQDVLLGPFVDSTDGNTEETALTIANTAIRVWKHGATTLADKNSGGATHIANGMYYAVLDATDTNTIGGLDLYVHVTGALPVILHAAVLDEAVYDVLFGTTAISTLAAGALMGLADTAITAAKFAAGAINAAAIATDAITAAKIATDAITEIQTGLATPTNITAGTITTVTNLTNLPAAAATAAELAKVPKSDSTVSWNATALAAINAEVDSALNTAIPGSPTANSVNERIATMDGLLLGTIAAGTHNPQSGDAFARLGAAGAGLTAIGDTRMANLDATVSSRLATSGYTAPPAVGAIADAVADEVYDGTLTLRESIRLNNSANFGESSGAPGGPVLFRDLADTKTRISGTIDTNGNRTAITIVDKI